MESSVKIYKDKPTKTDRYNLVMPIYTNNLKKLIFSEKAYKKYIQGYGHHRKDYIKAGYISIDVKKYYKLTKAFINAAEKWEKTAKNNKVCFTDKLIVLYKYLEELSKQKNLDRPLDIFVEDSADNTVISIYYQSRCAKYMLDFDDNNSRTRPTYDTGKEAFKALLDHIKPNIEKYTNCHFKYDSWFEENKPIHEDTNYALSNFKNSPHIKAQIDKALESIDDDFFRQEYKFRCMSIINTKKWHNGSDHWTSYEDPTTITIIAKSEEDAREQFANYEFHGGTINSGLSKYTLPYSKYVTQKIDEIKCTIKREQNRLKELQKYKADDLITEEDEDNE